MDLGELSNNIKEFKDFLDYQAKHQKGQSRTDYKDGWEMCGYICKLKFEKLFGDFK